MDIGAIQREAGSVAAMVIPRMTGILRRMMAREAIREKESESCGNKVLSTNHSQAQTFLSQWILDVVQSLQHQQKIWELTDSLFSLLTLMSIKPTGNRVWTSVYCITE